MPLAGAHIGVQSPADLLLHLIVHAVDDHEFSNGPLLLSDMAFLLDRHTVDWPLFWSLAQRHQQTKACVLALVLMEQHWGKKRIAWLGHEPADTTELQALTRLAAGLMLRDMRARTDVTFHSDLAHKPTVAAKAGHLLRKVFPTRAMVAAAHPVAASDWRVYLWYPVQWYQSFARRAPLIWRAGRQSALRHEVAQIGELRRWLAEPPRPN